MVEIFNKLNVQRVINASGRMTSLGVNTLSDPVIEAMREASQNYVDIDQLQRATGRRIATLIGAEDALITTGAAAGVALMVAACIAGKELTRIQALPDPRGRPNQILIQAGHQVNFGAPITQLICLAGGDPRPVGSVNSVSMDHLRGAISSDVAALIFVQSHHAVQKGMLSLKQCIEVCKPSNIPILVDAAAEEDLRRFVTSGADLVTFSGGKAIGGPTSGIVAGEANLVGACRAQNSGIGRPMKVGKEALVGLWQAVSTYIDRDVQMERKRNTAIVDTLLTGFEPVAKTRRLIDEAGRSIERAALVLDPEEATKLVLFLQEGKPPIYTRCHLLRQGIVAFDPRPLADEDVEIIITRVHQFFRH